MPKRKKGAGLSKVSKDARRMRLLRQDEDNRAKNAEHSRIYQQKKREDENFRVEMRMKQVEWRKVPWRRQEERKRNAMAMRNRRREIKMKEQISEPNPPSPGASSQNSLEPEGITSKERNVPSTVASSDSVSRPTSGIIKKKTETKINNRGRRQKTMTHPVQTPVTTPTETQMQQHLQMDALPPAPTQPPPVQVAVAKTRPIRKTKTSEKQVPVVVCNPKLRSLQKSEKFCDAVTGTELATVTPNPPSPGASSQNSLEQEGITSKERNVPSTVASSDSVSRPTSGRIKKKTETKINTRGRRQKTMTHPVQTPVTAPTETQMQQHLQMNALPPAPVQPPPVQVAVAKTRPIRKTKTSEKQVPVIVCNLKLPSLEKSEKFCDAVTGNELATVMPNPPSPGGSSQNSLEPEGITSKERNVPSTVASSDSVSRPTSGRIKKKTETKINNRGKRQKTMTHPVQTPVTAPTETQMQQHLQMDALPPAPAQPPPVHVAVATTRPIRKIQPSEKQVPVIVCKLKLPSLEESEKFCDAVTENELATVSPACACQGASNQSSLGKEEITRKTRNIPATVSSVNSLNLPTAAKFSKKIRTHFEKLYFKRRQQKTMTHPAQTYATAPAKMQIQEYLWLDDPPPAPELATVMPYPSYQGVSNQGSLGNEGITRKTRNIPATVSSMNSLALPTVAKFPKKTGTQFEILGFKHEQQNAMTHPMQKTPVPAYTEMQQHFPVNAPPTPIQEQVPAPPRKQVLIVANHERNIMSNLASLWKKGKFCDASIGNGMATVMVHKLVLHAVCPNLLSLSTLDIEFHDFLKVNLPEEVSLEALNAFAEYIYKGMLNLDHRILEELKIIAKRLDMKEFDQLCDRYLAIQMRQPTAATGESFTNVPLNETSLQIPSMMSSLPTVGSTISLPIQSSPSISTQVIDVKQEISESGQESGQYLAKEMPQPTAATGESYTNVPLNETSLQIPSMMSSLPTVGSTITLQIQSAPSISTQVIDAKQEISESGQESEVASLAPNKSGNTAGFVICPSVKTEPVGPEDDKYGHLSSNNNNQTFPSTVPSSSSSSLAADSTSITSVPASRTEFAVPFSETKYVKLTELKGSHLESDLSPVPFLIGTVSSQSNHMTETTSKLFSQLPNSSAVDLPRMSDKSVYPVRLFKSRADNLPP